MKTTVEGKELWTTKEIVNSNLLDCEVFGIRVGELRKINKMHEELINKANFLKLENEVLKQRTREHSRFVTSA